MDNTECEYTKLCELAKSGPEAFEKEARRLVDVAIDSCPEVHRNSLRSFQDAYERHQIHFNGADWFLVLAEWKKLSASDVTTGVKKYITSTPEKYHWPLKKYQRHLFHLLNLYDFEEWRNLYAQNPKEAEGKRLRVIEEHISYSLGDEKEIRRFQWRIDAERRKSKTPLGSFLFLRNMFFDLVYSTGGFLDQLKQFSRDMDGVKVILNDTEKKKKRDHLKLVVSGNKA